LEIKEEGSSLFGKFNNVSLTGKKSTSGKVKSEEVAIFCRQMATLVNAGVNILDAVSDIAMMMNNPYFSATLIKVAESVKAGKTLSESLGEYPKIFDSAFLSMILVGEKSGKLSEVLEDLAFYMEKTVKLRRKIKSAASYPVFVGCFFILVFFGLVLGLIPKFEEMFSSFGAVLPLPTRIVMGFSRFIIAKMPFLIAGLIACFITFKIVTKSPQGKMAWHKFFFKVPIFATIYTKMVFARFFQTLSTLIRSGVDIVSSLQIATGTVNNTYVRSLLTDIRDGVIAGETFSSKMDQYVLFPKIIVRMTAVGEKSGQLDQMFEKITDYYSDEVDVAVATLSAVIEPVLIIFLGFTIGIAVIALYLPIFNMAGAMSGGM
jgi:type IV pilus assembly protein PilC